MDNSNQLTGPDMFKSDKKASPNYIKYALIIVGALILLSSIVFGVWSYVQYADLKNNFDEKLSSRTTEASTKIEAQYEEKYQERIKSPSLTFSGPVDYGSVTFLFPKTWSVYVAKDITATNYNGDYEAYLNPDVVPPVSTTQPFALRVNILTKNYDSVLNDYSSAIKKGDLKSTPVTVNEVTGTRLDGKFSKEITGSAILIKIRDKTLVMRTDSSKFVPDFNSIIQNLKFSK